MRYRGVSVIYPRDMLRHHAERYVNEVLHKYNHWNITVVELYYDPSNETVLTYLYSKPDGYDKLHRIKGYPAETKMVGDDAI